MRNELARRCAVAVYSVLAVLACGAAAGATTLVPTVTLRAGTKINCRLDESVNSAALKAGSRFTLRVDDPSHPALQDAEIVGHVVAVTQPAGLTRARIAFLLDSVRLRNGSKEPIRAYVVNRAVVPYNPVAQRSASQMLPPVPRGTVTPGPIAWQMNLGTGKPVLGRPASGATGGYIYAQKSNEPILIHTGASVTIELAGDLHVP